jgi:hypothetical protein
MGGIVPLIDALIALLATLYAFAFLAATTTEFLQRVSKLREKRLRRIAAAFFDRVLKRAEEQLQASLKRTPAAGVASDSPPAAKSPLPTRDDFVRQVTKTAVDLAPDIAAENTPPKDPKDLASLKWPELLAQLRLQDWWIAREESFASVLKEGLDSLRLGFENVTAQAYEFVTRRVRLVALGVGLALAFACNLDGLRIFEHYVGNAAATATAMQSMEGNAADLEALRALVATSLETCEKQEVPDDNCLEALRQSGRALIEGTSDLVSSLDQAGVPIGYNATFNDPLLCWWNVELDCEPNDAVMFLRWFFGLFLTGLVIGVGAPQLHDALQALLELRGKKVTLPLPAAL